MGIARKGGVKACQDGLGHFFPTLLWDERACQDDLGHFFFHVCPFDRGRGSKAIWPMPRTNAFAELLKENYDIFQNISYNLSSGLRTNFSFD